MCKAEEYVRAQPLGYKGDFSTERNPTESVNLVNGQFSGFKRIEAVDGTNWHKIIRVALQFLLGTDQ